MKDYKIVTKANEQALAEEVKLLLQDGWIPLGGVAIDSGFTLYQAMGLPDTTAKPERTKRLSTSESLPA